MTAIVTFLGSMNKTWQGLTALAGSMGIGSLATVVLLGFNGLPDRVDVVETVAAKNTADHIELRSEYEHIVCLLILPDSVSRDESMRKCP